MMIYIYLICISFEALFCRMGGQMFVVWNEFIASYFGGFYILCEVFVNEIVAWNDNDDIFSLVQ